MVVEAVVVVVVVRRRQFRVGHPRHPRSLDAHKVVPPTPLSPMPLPPSLNHHHRRRQEQRQHCNEKIM
ncbi:hypothetical protein E2C01_090855 [Portunus trituberculatus]|uniref:Uncharacterized protein n=1 Tax=Portunus trituberculatus TaxID=210409 RepID=A0A5B7JMW4_PORTR|nr:hypothetical protein [Portunus trituberculatus]